MSITKRVQESNAYLSMAERIVGWGPLVIGTVATGGAAGWAASATEALARYSPLSWVACTILGGLFFVVGYWLWASAGLRTQQARFNRKQLERFPDINPLENTFTMRRININVFKPLAAVQIESKTFINCELYGLANIILNGHTTLLNLTIDACDFVQVKTGHPIANAIAFQDLTLRHCTLHGLTLLIPDYLAQSIPAGANWITPSDAPAPAGTPQAPTPQVP